MVHQIILTRLHIRGCAEVHSVCFASVLDLIIVARQADKLGVEFLQVLLQDCRVIARGIACYHEWEEHFAARLDHLVVHEGHLVEFVGADVRAVGEAEVDLSRYVSCALW